MFLQVEEKKVENVKWLDRVNPRKSSEGTLHLTATHLIFVDNVRKKETWILHMYIGSVEKHPITTAGSPLYIKYKNFMAITFIIPRERDCQDVYTSLLKLSQPASLEDLYAFQFKINEGMPQNHGWEMFNFRMEYDRMDVPNNKWVLTNINKDYEICDTYPRFLYVPASATTPVLVGSSKFRSRGRLPVLSYYHRNNSAAICRCSQPLAGFSARCVEDEQMLNAILRVNPESSFMYVVDTRPKINAVANKAAGKGYEKESFYSNIKFQFLGIENIHVMRSSLQKLLEVCELKNPSMSAFLSGLESSGWLKHVRAVMETSVFIAKAVSEGVSVLVHCSDGWDRTAQTCSLASLMLDPYYRTLKGFQDLIEKEWLAFGHKFTDRCGFLGTVDPKEVSPVFTQFIDAVWQMTHQFPCAFQFNERFLLVLHDHVFSCQYGTFIGNCEKDRIDLRLSERTHSLWGYIHKYMNDFINPIFQKDNMATKASGLLFPNTCPQIFRFWKGMYNRFDTGVHPREEIMDTLATAKEHSSSLEDHIRLLEMRINDLCKRMGISEEVIQRKLQCFSSMDSLDGVLLTEPTEENGGDKLSSTNLTLTKSFESENNHVAGKSDTESGFDESSSQLSRSGIDDGLVSSVVSLTSVTGSSEPLTKAQLYEELASVAIDWKPFRNVQNCSCAYSFEHFSKKYHCWKCGEVFCTRCIAAHLPLPGHFPKRHAPVCVQCYSQLNRVLPLPEVSAQVVS
ncbi:myotubularin-related protein 8 isoform X2 [Octopus bimaculoides]|uniref:myotubularin-related protein 8 isoform X2 n=1 Tax=Octopus bimaculoides TaxID=37653 RepID=UPI00071D58C5|nr:myotubularin-related protein 8 isoform X2 [Octopus bimaculoides]|eukprot:XP_014786257.1 PREDICTED: myotubularin-related protein 8-like isoform X2 [Octopus bimaculoides]